MSEIDQIFESDQPDMEKLAQAFDWVTTFFLKDYDRQEEVLRAIDDREALVKEQIKASTLRFARSIFNDCYRRTTGRKAWDE